MRMAFPAILLLLVSFLLGCGKDREATPALVSEGQRDMPRPPEQPEKSVAEALQLTPLEEELQVVITGANKRIQLDLTWAWAPAHSDTKRFPSFKKHNESRWNLELDHLKIPPGTLYEQTTSTEEGGSVSEHLFFDKGQITWWFDGRRDEFSEFKNPSIRKMKVNKLFLAVHDGQSGWIPIDQRKTMPSDHGLAIGIQLADGSRRYW